MWNCLGMYSRPVLLQSLREQKMQCARMMKVMASQTVQIESMSSSLEAEIQRRKKLEKSSKEAEEENRRGRMAAHHMQSEIGRLETIIEAMAIINPNQVQHLNQNQISFGFHDRSKAYDLDGKFDPYLTSSTYEGGLSVAESQPEPAKEAVAAAASALPTAAKVTVGTSTRDLAQTGDPEHTVMQWEKDQLKRVVWLLERFFVDAEADAKEELVYSAEESDADGSKGLRLAYHSLVKEEQLNSCSLLALLRDSMLFLKDGEYPRFYPLRGYTNRLCRLHNGPVAAGPTALDQAAHCQAESQAHGGGIRDGRGSSGGAGGGSVGPAAPRRDDVEDIAQCASHAVRHLALAGVQHIQPHGGHASEHHRYLAATHWQA